MTQGPRRQLSQTKHNKRPSRVSTIIATYAVLSVTVACTRPNYEGNGNTSCLNLINMLCLTSFFCDTLLYELQQL